MKKEYFVALLTGRSLLGIETVQGGGDSSTYFLKTIHSMA